MGPRGPATGTYRNRNRRPGISTLQALGWLPVLPKTVCLGRFTNLLPSLAGPLGQDGQEPKVAAPRSHPQLFSNPEATPRPELRWRFQQGLVEDRA